jgi:toxin ParE1/3/4
MAKYYFSNEAVEDLSEIWNYTFSTWSEKQADTYYELILNTCNELAIKPSLGKEYDIVTKGILGLRTGEHIIFYSVISQNEIEVARILHGMMDLKRKI